MRQLTFYIHIPKTGGTSLNQIFRNQIYFSRFWRMNPGRDTHPKKFLASLPDHLKLLPEKQLDHLEMFTGHFPFGIHNLMAASPNYVSILRDPVERVISEYFYMKQKGFYHSRDIEEHNLTVDDYLFHRETYYLNNLQTRLMSGVSYDEGDEITERIFLKALDNLKSCKVIGLTEYFVQSLALFYIKLGWSHVPVFTKINVNQDRPLIDGTNKGTLEKISNREKFDIKLYQAAEKIFQSEIEKHESEVCTLGERIIHPSKIYRGYIKSIWAFDKLKYKISSFF